MILKIKFKDNDFCRVVYKACEEFLKEVTIGHKGKDAIERYEKCKKKQGLDKIRIAIVKASHCNYLVNKSIRFDNININDLCIDALQYLNDNITIEEVSNFDENEFGDSDTCYVDFFNVKVYIN